MEGLRADAAAVGYCVEAPAGGGLWATACNPVSDWLLYVQTPGAGQAELYFKPFRNAPAGTLDAVSSQYEDGLSQSVTFIGTEVKLNPSER